jgi:hypothetical protein
MRSAFATSVGKKFAWFLILFVPHVVSPFWMLVGGIIYAGIVWSARLLF